MFGHHLHDDYLLSSQREDINVATDDDYPQSISQPFTDFSLSVTNSRPRFGGLTPSASFSSADSSQFPTSFTVPMNSAAALSLPLLHQSQEYWQPAVSMPTFAPGEGFMYPMSTDIINPAPNIFGGRPPIRQSSFPFLDSSTIPNTSFAQMSLNRQPETKPNSPVIPACYSPTTYASSQPMHYLSSSQFNSQTHVDSQQLLSSQPTSATIPYPHSQPMTYYNSPQPQYNSQLQYNSLATSAVITFTNSPATYFGSSQMHVDSQATPNTYDGSQHLTMSATAVKQCSNCLTTDSPTWRRHKLTQGHVCNACGLYFRLHERNREFVTNARGQRVVKRQPRGTSRRGQKSKAYTNALVLAASGASQPSQFIGHSSMATTSASITGMEYMSTSGYDSTIQPVSYIPSPQSENNV
ncbi:hypothetical protein GGH92_004064 [Coemansia sp. RSA 2673]|nr:hypothetical protein GGH92_004064 [Coemansia sp. RSA 2673]